MASLSDAMREAYATVPDDAVILSALEIRHTTFTEPLRFVRNNKNIIARIEAGAPANPGEDVDFVAISFEFKLPVTEEAHNPRLEIVMDNVGRDVTQYLEAAIEDGNPVYVTYREYLSDDLATPQIDPPLTVTLASVDVSGHEMRAVASLDDLRNQPFSKKRYDRNTAPNLFGKK